MHVLRTNFFIVVAIQCLLLYASVKPMKRRKSTTSKVTTMKVTTMKGRTTKATTSATAAPQRTTARPTTLRQATQPTMSRVTMLQLAAPQETRPTMSQVAMPRVTAPEATKAMAQQIQAKSTMNTPISTYFTTATVTTTAKGLTDSTIGSGLTDSTIGSGLTDSTIGSDFTFSTTESGQAKPRVGSGFTIHPTTGNGSTASTDRGNFKTVSTTGSNLTEPTTRSDLTFSTRIAHLSTKMNNKSTTASVKTTSGMSNRSNARTAPFEQKEMIMTMLTIGLPSLLFFLLVVIFICTFLYKKNKYPWCKKKSSEDVLTRKEASSTFYSKSQYAKELDTMEGGSAYTNPSISPISLSAGQEKQLIDKWERNPMYDSREDLVYTQMPPSLRTNKKRKSLPEVKSDYFSDQEEDLHYSVGTLHDGLSRSKPTRPLSRVNTLPQRRSVIDAYEVVECCRAAEKCRDNPLYESCDSRLDKILTYRTLNGAPPSDPQNIV